MMATKCWYEAEMPPHSFAEYQQLVKSYQQMPYDMWSVAQTTNLIKQVAEMTEVPSNPRRRCGALRVVQRWRGRPELHARLNRLQTIF